ncbi:MAG: PhnA domain protein [Robiginitomaculum sp.]|nr:MAG: PhnA domain protein [Robiginitomaculum sp.]
MSIDASLLERANNVCELCSASDDLAAYIVGPDAGSPNDTIIVACQTCTGQIDGGALNSDHWKSLETSMWSTVIPVQVLAWRMLTRLSNESWASDLLDMMYLEDDIKTWAEAGLPDEGDTPNAPTLDSNGAELKDGDTVTIIKDLVVKGAGFTAKRGTSVRNISLTTNPEHIEGRVNGTRIVLISAFLKKAV